MAGRGIDRSKEEREAVLSLCRADLEKGPLSPAELANFRSQQARKDHEAWLRIRPIAQLELPA